MEETISLKVGKRYRTRRGFCVEVWSVSDHLAYCSDGWPRLLNGRPDGSSDESNAIIEEIKDEPEPKPDAINPPHYKSHPSGVECTQIAEHFGFLLGNVIKYIWRADLKDAPIDDLEKAKWYLEREIAIRKRIR